MASEGDGTPKIKPKRCTVVPKRGYNLFQKNLHFSQKGVKRDPQSDTQRHPKSKKTTLGTPLKTHSKKTPRNH